MSLLLQIPVSYRENYGTVCTRTRYGYGVHGYGYGLGNPYLRYTHDEPYRYCSEWSRSDRRVVEAQGDTGQYLRQNTILVQITVSVLIEWLDEGKQQYQ